MIELLLVLVGLYALGFASVTLWYVKIKNESLGASVRQGATWWRFVVSKVKEKLNSSN